MDDDAMKVVLEQIRSDLAELKADLKGLAAEFAKMDKHNAEEHATIKAELLGLEKKGAGVDKKLVGAIVAMTTTLAGLATYAVHLLSH